MLVACLITLLPPIPSWNRFDLYNVYMNLINSMSNKLMKVRPTRTETVYQQVKDSNERKKRENIYICIHRAVVHAHSLALNLRKEL